MTPWSRWLLALSLALPPLSWGADVKVELGANALPAGTAGQNNLQKVNPIPTVGGSLNVPLDPKVGMEPGATDLAGAMPILPQTAVKPGEAGPAISSPKAGAGEWDAEIVLKNG